MILRPEAILWLLLISLLLLPVVMLNSISSATVAQMKMQADEIATLATGIRSYYADNVIARLQAAEGRAIYSENYRDVHGGIPIPATLSIELGALFDNAHRDGRISYAFLSDYPFSKRVSRSLDRFETEAINTFRDNPERNSYTQLIGNGLGRSTYRLATPVLMRQACVTCHNSHPDSPKRDWRVGDVRGIQEVTVRGLRVEGFERLGFLIGYVGGLGLLLLAATSVFQRQSRTLERVNDKLTAVHQRESELANRMSDQLQELSLFATAVDNSIVGIAIADMRKPDFPLVYVNNAFTKITGYTKDLAIGYNCRFLQGSETDSVELTRIREALRTGAPYSGELLNYRHDGSRFWNRLTLSPVGGTEGHPDFYVANQVDVTHLKLERGVPLDELKSIGQNVAEAQQSLEDALRFAEALSRRLRAQQQTDQQLINQAQIDPSQRQQLQTAPQQTTSQQSAVEQEALLRSEQQAHHHIREILSRLAAVVDRYRHAS